MCYLPPVTLLPNPVQTVIDIWYAGPCGDMEVLRIIWSYDTIDGIPGHFNPSSTRCPQKHS